MESYRRAVEILPDAPLIRIGLAQTMGERGDQAALDDAVEHLEISVRQDADFPLAWRLLSIAYGRSDRLGLSALASAERAILVNNFKEAVAFAQRADNLLPAGSPGQLRAQDIEFVAKQSLSRK